LNGKARISNGFPAPPIPIYFPQSTDLVAREGQDLERLSRQLLLERRELLRGGGEERRVRREGGSIIHAVL